MKKVLNQPPALSAPGFFHLPTPPAKKAGDYLRSYRSWVYSAVKLISTQVAAIDLKLFKRKTVGGKIVTEEIIEHPALSLIYHVNNFTTQYQMFELTQTYLELMGEAFWAVIRRNGVIDEMWALRPDWINIKADRGEITGYEYRPWGSGESVILKPEDVVPFRSINPENPYRGRGAVQPASMAIDVNDFSSEWQRAFFYNSAMPSIVFSTDQKIGEAEIQRFVKAWEVKHQGTRKAHQVSIMGSGLKPNILTGKLGEMGMQELQDWFRDEILSSFGVSKANLGITKEVNRATQVATDIRLIKQVIKPDMISLSTQLTEFLLPMFPDTESMFFDFADPVPPDTDQDLKYYESGSKHGWLTINEIRERENLSPVEGGNAVYLPFNVQPVGGVIEGIRGLFGKKQNEETGVITLKAEPKEKEFEHNVPIPVKDLRRISAEFRKRRVKDGIKGDLIKLITNVMAQKKSPEDTNLAAWKALIAQTDIWEMRLQEIIVSLFREQREDVLDRVTGVKSVKAFNSKIESFLFNLGVENTKWLKILIPFTSNVIASTSRSAFNELGLDSELNTNSRLISNYLKTRAGEMIEGINEFTRESLGKSLAEGVEKGEGIPKLTERVKRVFDIAENSRTRTIARTEVLRASNFATLESYKESGVVTHKEWFTAGDERVRPTHMAVHGTVKPLNEKFQVGADSMLAPSQGSLPEENINCRCIIRQVIGKSLKPISELRVGHAKLKSMEKQEKDLQEKIANLDETIKSKYQELEKDLPKLKEDILEDVKSQAISEKEELIQSAVKEKEQIMKDLRDLRAKAQEVVNEV